MPDSMMLGHMVYFTLKDSSTSAIEHQIAQCREYLTGHPGTAFFAVGVLTPDLAREVNDREFHVALHVVFETRQAHDDYQVSDRHQKFIADNKHNWAQVRVFDADVS